jgi:predicted alpha/beta superfamily hydrolase
MDVMFSLLIAALWAYICYNMAINRGRDGVYGLILGALFGLFAVIGYWIAGDKTPPISGVH